jgi:hypothetical protein
MTEGVTVRRLDAREAAARVPALAEALIDCVEAYARTFEAGGGKLRFVSIRGVPENGHALPNDPRLWSDRADAFIRLLGLAGRR